MCRLLRFLLLAVLIGSLAAPAWASDSYIQVPPDSSGKKLDTDQLTVGSNTVQRQRIQIGGTGATDVLPVTSTAGARVNLRNNAGTEIGTATNPVRTDTTGTTTQPISGSVTVTQGTGSNLHIQCDSGCAAQGDTTGNTQTYAAGNDASKVALSGQHGALFHLASGTLSATLTPEVSLDNDSSYVAAYFVNPTTGVISANQVLTNPNSAVDLAVVWVGSATHVRVRASSYTSGTADGTIRAVTNAHFSPIFGNNGSVLQAITTLTTGSKTPMTVAVVDSSGNQISSFGGSGGTSQADKSSFTEGTTNATPIAGVYNESITGDPTEDTAVVPRVTLKRGLHVNLRDAAGNELIPQTYNEDTPDADAEKLFMMGAVRRDTAASSALTDGDRATINVDATGQLWVRCGQGCSGGAQFNEDAIAADGALGTLALVVRKDTNGTNTSADGDYETLQVTGGHLKTGVFDSAGNRLPTMDAAARRGYMQITDGTTNLAIATDGGLNVHVANGTATLANDAGTFSPAQANVPITDSAMFGYDGVNYARVGVTNTDQLKVNCGNCTGSGLSQQDKTTFTPGTTNFVSGGAFYQTDPTTNSLTASQMGAFQSTQYRGLHVNLRNSAATEIGTSTTPIRTDPTGTTAQPSSQSGTWTVQPGNVANTTAWLVSAQQNGAWSAAATQSGTWTVQPGNNANTTPWLVKDSSGCAGATLANTTFQSINVAGGPGSAQILAGTGGQTIYICQINIVAAAAVNVAIITGTTTTTACDTGTAGVFGGSTAATGWNLAANGGIAMGNGKAVIQKGAVGSHLCLITSGAAQISGSITMAKF